MSKIISVRSFQMFSDVRGSVFPFEFTVLPFSPQRFFFTTANKAGTVRGQHGHYVCEQLLFSIRGEILITTKTIDFQDEYSLTPNGEGLYLPPGVWASQAFRGGDEILGCLASHPFDPSDVFQTPI